MSKTGLFFVVLTLLAAFGWSSAQAQTTASIEGQRAKLQAELEAEEQAIAQQTALLQQKQKETATVQGDIDLLKSQIFQAQTDIKAKKVQISRLDASIAVRLGTINTLDAKINAEQDSLAELLRQVRSSDSDSMVEILLGNAQLTDFFDRVDENRQVQVAINQSFVALRSAENAAQAEKAALEDQKNQTVDAQKAIETQQKIIQKREAVKQQLLAINKSQVKVYQSVLTARQKRAAEIRAALFGLRDSAAVPFGQALQYANVAAQKTGVRPAFLLAILKQESNLGENVGSCYLKDTVSGAGVGVNTGRALGKVMNPTRDVPIFLSLMSVLGRDPLFTKISCPQSVGWGGAMGPAQFIPSTWQLMQDDIGALVGKSQPDPWNPQDAFMAAALYLKNLGAKSTSYTAEMNAACRYYSGRACSSGVGSSYGKSVMAQAQDIQLNMIDPLQNT